MSQTEQLRIISAVRSLYSRFYGTFPDLHDLSRIVLMTQELHGGFTHELILDVTREDGYAWITETVEDIPIDDGWLSDAVTWLDEADVDEMRRPSNLAVKTCWILANE